MMMMMMMMMWFRVFELDENEGNTTEKRETLDFRVSKIFKKPKKKNSSPFLLTFSTKHTHTL
jgi:hypothetical protein